MSSSKVRIDSNSCRIIRCFSDIVRKWSRSSEDNIANYYDANRLICEFILDTLQLLEQREVCITCGTIITNMIIINGQSKLV